MLMNRWHLRGLGNYMLAWLSPLEVKNTFCFVSLPNMIRPPRTICQRVLMDSVFRNNYKRPTILLSSIGLFHRLNITT